MIFECCAKIWERKFIMTKPREKKNHFAGGLGLLAATAYLCVRGLKQVDTRLKGRETKRSPAPRPSKKDPKAPGR